MKSSCALVSMHVAMCYTYSTYNCAYILPIENQIIPNRIGWPEFLFWAKDWIQQKFVKWRKIRRKIRNLRQIAMPIQFSFDFFFFISIFSE